MKRSLRTTSSTAIRHSVLAALVSGLAAGLALRAGASDKSPSQVVDALSNRVIAVLQDKNLTTDQRHTQIEAIAYDAMDFETLSKLVLARNWTKFSPAQQSEFIDQFKRHLSITYGRNFDTYKNEQVQILGERPEARGDVTVQTKILRGGHADDVLVDYRLRQHDGQWKIIDVIVENVSLVSNFRSQFQDIVATGGPDRLLTLLKEKNDKGEPLQAPATPEKS